MSVMFSAAPTTNRPAGSGSGSGSSAAHSRGNIHLTTSLDVLLWTVLSFSFINKHSLLLPPPSSCCCSFVFFRFFLLRCLSHLVQHRPPPLLSAAADVEVTPSSCLAGFRSAGSCCQVCWCVNCFQSEALITHMWTHQKQDGCFPTAGRR